MTAVIAVILYPEGIKTVCKNGALGKSDIVAKGTTTVLTAEDRGRGGVARVHQSPEEVVTIVGV